MRILHEIVIVIMEILGMLSVSLGLGGVASWWLGIPGMLTVTGLVLLGFATLVALRQKAMSAPPNESTNGRR